jgi:predicted GNAT superfamily acetyltransferase
MDSIEIRPVQTIDEYIAVRHVELGVWGNKDIKPGNELPEVAPNSIMITAHKNGGLVLGAFDTSVSTAGKPFLAGFSFSFVGLTAEGKLKHCLHEVGVLPAYRDRSIGYQLFLAHRDDVRKRGVDLMTWTFHPLESRNAYLYLHKLGATAEVFLENVYGSRQNALNGSLPSDRLQIDWHLAPAPAANEKRLSLNALTLSRDYLHSADERPVIAAEYADHSQWCIQIPDQFQEIRSRSVEDAMKWQMDVRLLFQIAFEAGFVATDFIRHDNYGLYLLEQSDGIDPGKRAWEHV